MCDHVIRFIKRLMSGAQMLACSSRGQLRAVYGEGVCNMKQRQILGLCVSVKSLTWLLLYSGTEKAIKEPHRHSNCMLSCISCPLDIR